MNPILHIHLLAKAAGWRISGVYKKPEFADKKCHIPSATKAAALGIFYIGGENRIFGFQPISLKATQGRQPKLAFKCDAFTLGA